MFKTPARTSGRGRRGFTITELLVVVAVILVLLGLLLPALRGVWSAGEMTKSMSNMRQIALWMHGYSSDYADHIVPSRFNYEDSAYQGKVRSSDSVWPSGVYQHAGTWADILWAQNEVGVFPGAGTAIGNDYLFNAPDFALYSLLATDEIQNPFRSASSNTQAPPEVHGGTLPVPYGRGTRSSAPNTEVGFPGYFAANDFFNSGWPTGPDEGEWFTNGQIRFPDKAMYLVDSFYGATIANEPYAYDGITDDPPKMQVDFRYAGDLCLMLFMDGHIDDQGIFDDLDELESRGVRVRNLTSR